MSGTARTVFVESRERGPLARIAPRVRLGGAIAFLFALAFLHSAAALVLALGAAGLALALSRAAMRPVLRRLLAVEGFLLVLLLTLPLTMPGQPLFTVFGLDVSAEGGERALVLLVRVNAAVLMIAALLSQMGTRILAEAMTGIGIPARLAHLFQLMVRYLDVFQSEYQRLSRAMRARGFRPGNNRHTWRSLGHLLGMLLVRSAERAERVAWAMRARGFDGTMMSAAPPPLARPDLLFIGGTGVLIALLAAFEILS